MKYDETRVNIILDAIADGCTQKDAAILANVSPDTISDWKREHPDFAKRVAQKEVENKKRHIKIVQEAAINTWQAAAWWLERKFSEEYGQRVKQDVSISEANKAQAEAVKKLVEGITAEEEGSSEEAR